MIDGSELVNSAPAEYIESEVKGGFYKGYAVNGVPNGVGVLTYVSGDVYEGEFKDGYLDGKGKILFSDGDIYEGEWIGGRFNGYCKITYASGDVHEGEWDEGYIVNAKGKLIHGNGDYYDGVWEERLFTGKARETKENGDVYEGKMKNFEPYGNGNSKLVSLLQHCIDKRGVDLYALIGQGNLAKRRHSHVVEAHIAHGLKVLFHFAKSVTLGRYGIFRIME